MCLPFLLNLVWTFHPLLRRVVHLFPEGDDPYVAFDVVCLWEEVNSGTSYAPLLDFLLVSGLK